MPNSQRRHPLYLTLADRLQEVCEHSAPGQRLPSENEIIESYDMSRPTVRAALEELERRHLIRRTRGSGTFVAQRVKYVISDDSTPSWRQTIRNAGAEPEVRILSLQETRPTDQIRRELDLAEHDRVLTLQRLGLVNGVAATVQNYHIPKALAPDTGDALRDGGSLYRAFRSLGFTPQRLWHCAELAIADPAAAELLGYEGRSAIWRTSGVLIDADSQRRLEYFESWVRPDVLEIRVEWGRHGRLSPADLHGTSGELVEMA